VADQPFWKKGMLCLAFAAVLGGCAQKPSSGPAVKGDPDIDYEQPVSTMSADMIHLRNMALQAETYQTRTEFYAKQLKAGKIKQDEFDQAKKDDDLRIAGLRSEFVGKPSLPFFDGIFHHELQKHGFPIPEKMPEMPAKTPAPPPPGAKK
jgi:hypothetical protein